MSAIASDFFDRKREWSRRKHEVLEGYVPQFSRILGRDRSTVYFVDGFAGRGYYGEGQDREDGSPLLAAKTARDLAVRGQYDLRCINIEADASEHAELVAVTEPYAPWVENRRGRFDAHLDHVLTRIGSRPTLFFLDPFGPSGLEWATLEKIGRRPARAKTELLINFNAPKVDRHGGWLDSFGQKPQAAFLRLLDRIFGCEEWRRIWGEPAPSEKRYRRIARFYLDRVHDQFGFGGAAYPVRTIDTQQLKYFLLFFTRHPLGLRIMNSVLYGVEERYLTERARLMPPKATQLSMFEAPPPSIEEMEQEALGALQADILDLGARVGRIAFGPLQDQLLPRWFGRMKERHFRKACATLIEEGEIVRKDAVGIKDDTLLIFRQR